MATGGMGTCMWTTWGRFAIILLVMSGSIVVAAPTCGQHEYLDNGQCLPCPTCPPGYGVSGPCGFGQGALTTCTPCEPNPEDPLVTWPTFSDSTNQERCQPCKLCDNSHYSVNCSVTTNSHCGPCLFGFFRTHPDEENCLPCKHVMTPYVYLCQDWLDAQKTTTVTITAPPMDISTEPVTTTKNMRVTSNSDVLSLSSENDSNGYINIPIIVIAVFVGLGVVIFIAHKCGFLPCRNRGNPGPVESGDSEAAAEQRDDTDDPEAVPQPNTELINLEEVQTQGQGEEETDTLLPSKSQSSNSITPAQSGVDKEEDGDSSEDDSQNGNSSSNASSTSSLDSKDGDTTPVHVCQGDANDCSDPSSGTELILKGPKTAQSKRSNKRANYGSNSQKSRLSSQLPPPSSSSSEGSINGTVEGGLLKQNSAVPCRTASPAVARHPTAVHWSAQGGTAEVLIQDQNAFGTSNHDVHKGSRPVVELHGGLLVNQTARPHSEPATECSKKAEKVEMTKEIKQLFATACDKFGGQGIEQLHRDTRDVLSNYLDPPPEREGAYCYWEHLADRFGVERPMLQNLQGMSNLLQLLGTRNNCSIMDLLNNVAAIKRFDALEAACVSLHKTMNFSDEMQV
ncbi:uncharacterized protein LOC144876353 isoform X2 [Branchiostoma floridae x Branchiostoma japonicum]